MATRDERVPDLLLERLAAGELPPAEAAAVRRRLETESGGAARLEALQRSNEEILAALPPAVVAREVLRRKASADRAAAARRPVKRGLYVFLPVLAAAGAFAVSTAAPPPPDDPGALEGPDTTRVKGACEAPCLLVYREGEQNPQRLRDGDAARPADHLQLGYQSVGRPFGVVLSIDGRGAVTLHHPERVGESQALVKAGTGTIPRAYQLDDAPRFERFFLVTSATPLDVGSVLDAARRLAQDPQAADRGALALPGAAEQTSVLLRKVTP